MNEENLGISGHSGNSLHWGNLENSEYLWNAGNSEYLDNDQNLEYSRKIKKEKSKNSEIFWESQIWKIKNISG